MDVNDISRIGVIGAGLMGHGIALNFALKGFHVFLNDTTQESLERAMKDVEISLATLESVGLAEDSSLGEVLPRIHTSTSLAETVAEVDFVVEAVFEDMGVKHDVFSQLDQMSPEHTILSSNTSSFMSSQLAAVTKRPAKVVVANWWNPPTLLPLIEVVRGPDTSDHTIDTTVQLFKNLGKRPVVLQKESMGFIGNRMQFALLREAISVVEEGIATAQDVDDVVKSGFGRRLSVAGPFEVFDLAGWDTISHIIDQLFPVIESSPNSPELIKEKLDKGKFGVKSGEGFYFWNDKSVVEFRERIGRALAAIDRLSRN